MMVFAAMNVPRFCSCFSHTKLQICFNVYKCTCTQQSTPLQQLGERDLGKNTCTNEYQENKHGPVHMRQKFLNEMLFFSLRFLSHGCNFFF